MWGLLGFRYLDSSLWAGRSTNYLRMPNCLPLCLCNTYTLPTHEWIVAEACLDEVGLEVAKMAKGEENPL